MSWDPERYLEALHFAADAHCDQKVPGTDRPYLVHCVSVAQEVMGALAGGATFDADLSVACALLHDVIEDTSISPQAVVDRFGADIAEGVLALSKDKTLPSKQLQMEDSLERIRRQPHAVWAVKMADRITNLQPPPTHWGEEKINSYRSEAQLILRSLNEADGHLARRLEAKIAAYPSS